MRIPLITTVYDKNDNILSYDVRIDTESNGNTLSANLHISPEAFDLSPLESEIQRLLNEIVDADSK